MNRWQKELYRYTNRDERFKELCNRWRAIGIKGLSTKSSMGNGMKEFLNSLK